MELINQTHDHLSDNQIINYDVTSDNAIRIRAHIAIVTDKFVDYQKDLIAEFIADLSNEAHKQEMSFRKFKWYVEFALQELNSKLAVFAEKVTDTPSFDIRGIIEVFHKHEYLASLIGDVSFIILRQNKVYYSLFNETSKRVKISLFSDFVEGDLADKDQIVVIGSDIDNIVDESDLSDLSEVVGSTDDSFVDLLMQTIEQRAGTGMTAFESHTLIKSDYASSSIPQSTSKLKHKLGNWFTVNQYQVGMIIFGCVIAGLVYSIISNYRAQYSSHVVVTPTGKQIDITLDSINKDISLFQRLDATSPNKITTYNDIKNKIDLLEESGQSPLDIQTLKKVLQEEYYKGFRINTVNQFDTKVLDFTDSDIQSIGEILGIYIGKDGFHVGGTKASLIGSVNNQLKGSLIRYSTEVLSDPLKGCASSLGRVWLYCYDSKWQIYLITKSGLESVKNTTTNTNFPAPIAGLGTFASSNLYVLTNNSELNASNTHIVRYQAIANNPSNLKEPLNYSFASSGWLSLSAMTIDGTFIMWNGATKQLIQFWRDGVTSNDRIIPIKWWDNIDGAYSATGVSIVSYDTSKYVYLRDAPQWSLTVFVSNPSKTNETNKSSFTLEYVMRIKFDSALWVKWVIISDAVKPQLWAVTNKGVFLYNLSQDIEQYAAAPKTQ
jgi:hypothetical protein